MMTCMELGKKLREMYDIKGANKSTMIHLFGIIYADEIRNSDLTPVEIVKAAQLPESYKAEVQKGMNLSMYVDLKPEYKNYF